MKLSKPKNENYSAIIVKINTLVPLSNCDKVQAAIIMGNQVIVGMDIKVGDIGLYFPLECQLSKAYLSANNLYRKSELNSDSTKAGYFEENGRIRCVKFRGNKSEGIFMPLESLDFIPTSNFNKYSLDVDDVFDEIDGIEICRKYVIKTKVYGPGNTNKQSKKPIESKIIENQFRFHNDTSMLYRNLHKIKPDSLIHISYKIHGTSAIASKLLCKRPLKWYERVLKFFDVNISDTQYDYIYASRKVIKNSKLNPNANHYYSSDIWKLGFEELKDYLQDGMTIYYEIAGFMPEGGSIQKFYDYGCEPDQHKKFIYRITYTNPDGKVFEFSAPQVQQWCKKNGLEAVPELYYGKAKDCFQNLYHLIEEPVEFPDQKWEEEFLVELKDKYNDKDCYICKNKVPEEGCVIRIEGDEFEAYKCKSEAFYRLETKMLDKGEVDIEEEN